MRILLDTNIFIRWDSHPESLPEQVRVAIQDESKTLVLSVVSVWEMQIKHQLGKLTLRLPIEKLIKDQEETNAIEVLPVTLEHVFQMGHLPLIHKDPFDRLLIAQAKAEGIPLLTVDSIFGRYDIPVIG